MSAPPELTDFDSVNDFVNATMRVTGVVMVEIRHRTIAASNRWLVKHWSTYFTPEQQDAILADFTMRRLSK